MKKIRLEGEESITSYDVSSLFTSIPLTSAMEIIRNKLEQDTKLSKRTTMSANNIRGLLEFCLSNTYFLFQSKFYEETMGAAKGSPLSPMMANLCMESFEHRAIASAVNPPNVTNGNIYYQGYYY